MKSDLDSAPKRGLYGGFPVEQLQDSTLMRIFDLIGHFTIAFDRDFCLLYANRTALESCEKSFPEIQQRPLFEVFPHLEKVRYNGRFKLNTILRKVWREGFVLEHSADLQPANKNTHQEVHRFIPLVGDRDEDSSGDVVGVLLLAVDIAAIGKFSMMDNGVGKFSTLEPKTLEISGEDRQRLKHFSEIAQLAVTTADQINTPLNVILGNAELIRNRLQSADPSVAESFEIINREVKSIADLLQQINRLRTSATGESGIETAPYIGPAIPPPAAAPVKQITRNILVVDDEEYMLSLLREVIRTLGFHPVTATNGLQALNKLSTQAIDLVITDINMPGMSGIELLKKVKRQLPRIPVVLITGYGKERAAEAAREFRADGFIGKPFHIEELRFCIDQLLL